MEKGGGGVADAGNGDRHHSCKGEETNVSGEQKGQGSWIMSLLDCYSELTDEYM